MQREALPPNSAKITHSEHLPYSLPVTFVSNLKSQHGALLCERPFLLLCKLFSQGRVRTKTVKKAARSIIEKWYSKLGNDFHLNKKLCNEIAVIPSKRLRNKIAGYITHTMKRIARGPVRGISLRLQEEERERRMDIIPEKSALAVATVEVDPETNLMFKSLGVNIAPVTVTVGDVRQKIQRRGPSDRPRRDAPPAARADA